MAQLCKLENVVELKSSTTKIFDVLTTNQAYKVPQASGLILGVKSDGSIRTWEYILDGKSEVFKEKMEVDKTNNLITLTAVGGSILEMYKNFRSTYQFMPKQGLLKLSFNCEKNPDTPPPTMYMEFVVKVIKDIDANLN